MNLRASAILIAAPFLLTGATINNGPAAVIDLTTADGVALVRGDWRYSDTRIVETQFRKPGPDGQPSNEPSTTYDYTPHAGGADFDDSRWERVAPERLDQRRGAGRLGFSWYRINIRRRSGSATLARPARRQCSKHRWMITPRSGWMAS